MKMMIVIIIMIITIITTMTIMITRYYRCHLISFAACLRKRPLSERRRLARRAEPFSSAGTGTTFSHDSRGNSRANTCAKTRLLEKIASSSSWWAAPATRLATGSLTTGLPKPDFLEGLSSRCLWFAGRRFAQSLRCAISYIYIYVCVYLSLSLCIYIYIYTHMRCPSLSPKGRLLPVQAARGPPEQRQQRQLQHVRRF